MSGSHGAGEKGLCLASVCEGRDGLRQSVSASAHCASLSQVPETHGPKEKEGICFSGATRVERENVCQLLTSSELHGDTESSTQFSPLWR